MLREIFFFLSIIFVTSIFLTIILRKNIVCLCTSLPKFLKCVCVAGGRGLCRTILFVRDIA